MTAREVATKIEALRDEAAEAGVFMWGWDDGSIIVAERNYENQVFVEGNEPGASA